MTRTFQTGPTNDLVLNAEGDLSIVSGLDACLCNCATAIKAQRGEMQYAVNTGMPTKETAWDDYNPVQFQAAARVILSGVADVIEVKAFNVDRSDSILRYTAVIRTSFGVGQING